MRLLLAGALLAEATAPGFAQRGSTGANEAGSAAAWSTRDPKGMSGDELRATVKRLDAQLFAACNTCELDSFGLFFPEHLEFYHDQTGGGPMTRKQLMAAVKQNICGKVHRELVSLEVFSMKDYGALETGVHRFSHPGIDGDQGDAKFMQLWKYEGGRWWLTVVISYAHNEPVGGAR